MIKNKAGAMVVIGEQQERIVQLEAQRDALLEIDDDKDEEMKQLEERVQKLEDAIEDTLAHRGPDWASILRYALGSE